MTAETRTPYLSVVVTTRNDDHGGDPLRRLQAFVNVFEQQCRRTGLSAELIVVEWNPPHGRARVGSLLRLPDPPFCTYRFVEVPAELHDRLQYADVLPLFQMIAKNVGIRRARGEFVLATNIDIILSSELIDFIAARRLQRGRIYRVDRHDIQSDLPIDAPLGAQMQYCRAHQLRVHTRSGSYAVDGDGRVVAGPHDIVDGRVVRLGRGWHVREGDEASPYRWASESADLIISPDRSALPAKGAVLDVVVESNPYHAQSWVEVAAIEGDRTLLRTQVSGRGKLTIPLGADSRERHVELRVIDSCQDSRRSLPAFERRDALLYRVLSAEVSAEAEDPLFDYPLARWTNANEGSTVRLTATANGLAVETDPRTLSYATEYGPLTAPSSQWHEFELTFTLAEGGVQVGLLNGTRQRWLATSVHSTGKDRRRLLIGGALRAGQRFWIVVSNAHPNGEGVSRFVVHQLKGSADPATTVAQPRRRSDGLMGAVDLCRRLPIEVWQRVRPRVVDVADRIAAKVGRALGERVRYRIVRNSPEHQELERSLRTSDAELREIAALRHLTAFNEFLTVHRPANLHLNGCGDFQLMAREHWDEIRGYPEFETFSMNIDGVLSHVADAAGVREEILDMPIYHLEHEVGSGWSPEGGALLRRRIAERGITWLDASTVYTWAAYMHWLHRPMLFNGSAWGLADHPLPERTVEAAGGEWLPARPSPTHAVFTVFDGFDGWAEPGFERGFYGSNIRDWLYAGVSKGLNERRQVHIGHPPVDEEYFEWIALATAVANTSGRFCFAELGAGWGRWMISAAALCRQKGLEFSLIAVEPEPSHFEWLRMVLEDNDISPDAHELFLGAVASRDGELLLAGPDEPKTAYGNRTIARDQLASWDTIPGYVFRPVASVTLATLFAKHDLIDLVDMDVQGSEAEIVAHGIDVLNRKVRIIHIGTHSPAVEAELTALFSEHGWLNAFSFPGQTEVFTPFGTVAFGDGAQTWVNPRWPERHAALVGGNRP